MEFFGDMQAADEYRSTIGAEDKEVFLIEKENTEIIQAFLVIQSQFRRSSFRYEGVKAGLSMAGIKCNPELFGKLRLIEAGALQAINEHESSL